MYLRQVLKCMLNMMPLSRHVLSLQTRLHRWFILGTIIPPTTCTSDKGKQTNKQAEAAQMQGAVWSCITCRVWYTMHQSMWKSFGDASEMHWKSVEFDTQGRTLTPLLTFVGTHTPDFNNHSSSI